MFYNITPVPAPRMTQSDRWAKRPCVQRYFAFRDEVKNAEISFKSCGAHITFIMPMPKSWSARRKRDTEESPHLQTPDIDNLLKALLDACYTSDSHIWDIRATKVWGYIGGIEIEEYK